MSVNKEDEFLLAMFAFFASHPEVMRAFLEYARTVRIAADVESSLQRLERAGYIEGFKPQ